MEMQSLLAPPPPEYLEAFRNIHRALAPRSLPDLLVSLAVIAVLPGLCEELVVGASCSSRSSDRWGRSGGFSARPCSSRPCTPIPTASSSPSRSASCWASLRLRTGSLWPPDRRPRRPEHPDLRDRSPRRRPVAALHATARARPGVPRRRGRRSPWPLLRALRRGPARPPDCPFPPPCYPRPDEDLRFRRRRFALLAAPRARCRHRTDALKAVRTPRFAAPAGAFREGQVIVAFRSAADERDVERALRAGGARAARRSRSGPRPASSSPWSRA